MSSVDHASDTSDKYEGNLQAITQQVYQESILDRALKQMSDLRYDQEAQYPPPQSPSRSCPARNTRSSKRGNRGIGDVHTVATTTTLRSTRKTRQQMATSEQQLNERAPTNVAELLDSIPNYDEEGEEEEEEERGDTVNDETGPVGLELLQKLSSDVSLAIHAGEHSGN